MVAPTQPQTEPFTNDENASSNDQGAEAVKAEAQAVADKMLDQRAPGASPEVRSAVEKFVEVVADNVTNHNHAHISVIVAQPEIVDAIDHLIDSLTISTTPSS